MMRGRHMVVAILGCSMLVIASQQDSVAQLNALVRQFGAYSNPVAPDEARISERMKRESAKHEFSFARLAYPMCSGYIRGYKLWSTDFPKADRQLLMSLKRLMILDMYEGERPVRLGQKEIQHFPFIYIVEPAYMCLNAEHAAELQTYLQAGGFLFIDDFWGTVEWDLVQKELRKILPATPIIELDVSHPMFQTVFPIEEFIQVPNVGQGIQGGPTWESDGYKPFVHGMYDESGRLMVVIFRNTDIADAWEWAENPYYPLKYGNYAYRIAANVIAYAMSH